MRMLTTKRQAHARPEAKSVAAKHAPARRYVYPDARPSRPHARLVAIGSGWSGRTRRGGARLIRLAGLLLVGAVAAAAAAVAAHSQPAGRDVGVGVIAGDPTGGTAKLWLDDNVAADAGIGFSGSVTFWGDLLWHDWRLLPQPAEGKLGLYLGAGPRVEGGDDAEFGVRTVGGLSWRLTKSPLEFFAEAGPVFRMTQGGGVDADGGIGVRLYLR